MSLTNFIVGIGMLIFCIFIITTLPYTLAGYDSGVKDMATIFLLFLGLISVFIGGISK